jgi:RPA family protein
MKIRRMTANKVGISEIVGGKFYPGSREDMKPSYVVSDFGEKLSRVNVVATVTDKFISDDRNYASITIDDGSGAIQAKVFGDDVKIIENVGIGRLAVVIGKVKEYNDEVYINAESIRTADVNYENLRKAEILDRLIARKDFVNKIRQMADQMDESEVLEYVKNIGLDKEQLQAILERKEVDYKPKMLELIESMDDGEGTEIGKIFEISKLPDHIIERTIDELLNAGEIYEPIVGKLKRIKS